MLPFISVPKVLTLYIQVVFRAMGAKVGKRVYWPGSGIKCLDPELLEIGDDVVFGSRSHFVTSDRLGSAKIVVGDGGWASFFLDEHCR